MGVVSATNEVTGVTYVNGKAIPKPGVLQSVSYARLVNLVSEGPVQGLANSVNPLMSVYFNGTVVQDPASSAYNFAGVQVAQAYGIANQSYIPGFSSAETPVSIGTTLTHATPLVHTTSSGNVDAVRVTMQYPNGLQSIDSKGNSNPTSVTLNIYTKLTSSGTWTLFFSNEVTNGKADPGFQKDYYLTRPAGTGTWDIKVERVTADSATPNTLVNATAWYAMTEIQDVKLAYPNSALVDVVYDAKNAPSPFPMTFDFYGILCSVPSNYNATTRVYSGVWDGTFTSTKVWTDNPAYHLYELLTNTRWGMGNFISPSQIDLSSLYAAGVYNDGMVSDGNGGTEPRFRFNGQITVDEDAWKFLQTFASTFNAMIICSASGLVTVIQDRPTSSTVMVTNAMVSQAGFQYSSGAGATRPTSTRVSFNDVNKGWQLREIVETDTTTTFPFLQTSVAAWGCTSEGQARRIARWNNDTNLRNTQIVSYRAPLHHLNVTPGTVITIADSVAAGITDGGKVLSVSGTTVNLDRPITVTSGTNTLMIRLADGITLAQATITSAAGTYSTVTISTALTQAVTPGADFILTNTISPQLYRVTDVKEVTDDTGYWFDVTAIQYDPNKYSRIETGVAVAAPVFYEQQGQSVVPGACSSLVWSLQAPTAVDTVQRDLKVSWTAGTNASTYYVQYRRSGDTWTDVQNVGQTSFIIRNVTQGQYDFNVYGISKYGVQSPVCSGSYGVDLSGTTTAVISPVTNLIAVGGGTTFITPDLSVQWTNPTSNANLNPGLKDFVVNVYTTGGTLLRTETVAGVAAGASASYTYSYSKNLADNANVPIRSVRIDVVARDGVNNLVTATSQTFTNAAPATPSSISVVGGYGTVFTSFTLPTDPDFKGVLVWASLTSGFTPSSANCVYDGSDSVVNIKPLGTGVHYVKIAAYDSFGKDFTGATLNVSSQFTGTPQAAGIPNGTTNPGSGTQGDLFFNTTDNKLYRYTGSAWTAAVAAVDVTGSLSASQIASVNASAISGTISDTQIAAMSASKLTGSVVDSQIASLGVTKLSGLITGTQVAANTILGSNIAGGTITAGNLASGIITTNYLAAGAVTANNIAAGAVTTGKLVVTGQGKALNADPTMTDITAWNILTGNGSVYAPGSSPVGTNVMSLTGTGAGVHMTSNTFPVQSGKTYKVSVWVTSANSAGALYIRMPTMNGAGTQVDYAVTGLSPTTSNLEGLGVPTSWTQYIGYITPSGGACQAYLEIYNNWSTGSYNSWVTDFRCEEYIGGDLIVNGTITGTKVAAGTITGSNIAANTITSSNILANTITAGQIASSTITSSQIASNTIVASNIASGTITGTQIAASAISTTQLAASAVTAAKMSVTSLDTVSATIGTLRTAASGQRMEVQDNRIRIYDASNVLRVKIGDLS